MKKYQIIYADPPWKYDFANNKHYKIENHYLSMATEDICKLDIPSDKNSVLFLWATAPKLLEAIMVMDKWGFKYKTHMVWDKVNKGLGFWFRGQHELLLVGVKGKFSPPLIANRVASVYSEKKSGHSKKPNYFRRLINEAFPTVTKIELFARKPQQLLEDESWQGWDVWGNEVESDIKL